MGVIEEIRLDIHAYCDNSLVSFNVAQLLEALDGYKAGDIENPALC